MLFRKVHGSWLGKVVGSAYGMPYEGKDPRAIWQEAGQLAGWQAAHGTGGGVVNDDEQFEVVALLCMEEVGLDGLTLPHLARYWREYLDRNFLFTAERQVYQNWKRGVDPTEAARPEHNPWYDFIGAQMKGEIFGQVAPGDLALAARLARVDGAVAHHGVGIDGEVFVATMVSQAMTATQLPTRADLERATRVALTHCDPEGQYVGLCQQVVQWVHECPAVKNWQETFARLEHWWREEYLAILLETEERTPTHPHRHQVLVAAGINPWRVCHVLPNAGILLIALLYGAGDFSQTLQLAAMMGYDADCNVGNLGGILGAYYGDARLPAYWTEPIDDEILVVLKGWEDPSLSRLARRVQALARPPT